MANADASARLALRHAVDVHLHVGAGPGQDAEQRRPGRIQAQVHDLEVRAGQGGGRDGPERGRRNIAGNGGFHGLEGLEPLQPDGVAVAIDPDTKRGEGQLRMISCGDRLVNRCATFGLEARQQHGALDLRAGHVGREVDGRQPSARDREGRQPSLDSKRAPIRVSGAMMRRMGRRRSESSPVIVAANRCAARTPESSRVVVPELPASRWPAGD